MDLIGLTEELRGLMELFAAPTQPIPKLRKAIAGKYGYDPEPSVGTKASRPSSMARAKGDGDGTKAGVQHKDVPGDVSKTAKRGRNTKTQVTPPAKGEKPSCPGGQEPRMVFGKWRCGALRSKGAAKAKSRIAGKRKQKAKTPKRGALAQLVHKARAALKGLFK
jgi:hypothetical protein